MAVKKHNASPAEQFVASLNKSQRNHLRVLLLHERACHDLKHALGIEKQTTVSAAAHATGLAKIGQTIRLFKDYAGQGAANLRVTR